MITVNGRYVMNVGVARSSHCNEIDIGFAIQFRMWGWSMGSEH